MTALHLPTPLWLKTNKLFLFFAGYLAVSLFLNESHELLLLLVNTVLKVGVQFLQRLSSGV